MSPKQTDIYNYMKKFHLKNNYPISLSALSEHFNVEYQTIQHHIKALIKGKFVYKPKGTTGIYLVK